MTPTLALTLVLGGVAILTAVVLSSVSRSTRLTAVGKLVAALLTLAITAGTVLGVYLRLVVGGE